MAIAEQAASLGAGVVQRVLSGVAKFLAGRFFKALERHIDERNKDATDATDAAAA